MILEHDSKGQKTKQKLTDEIISSYKLHGKKKKKMNKTDNYRMRENI